MRTRTILIGRIRQAEAAGDEAPRCPICDYRLLRIFSNYFCSNCRELIQPCPGGEH